MVNPNEVSIPSGGSGGGNILSAVVGAVAGAVYQKKASTVAERMQGAQHEHEANMVSARSNAAIATARGLSEVENMKKFSTGDITAEWVSKNDNDNTGQPTGPEEPAHRVGSQFTGVSAAPASPQAPTDGYPSAATSPAAAPAKKTAAKKAAAPAKKAAAKKAAAPAKKTAAKPKAKP